MQEQVQRQAKAEPGGLCEPGMSTDVSSLLLVFGLGRKPFGGVPSIGPMQDRFQHTMTIGVPAAKGVRGEGLHLSVNRVI